MCPCWLVDRQGDNHAGKAIAPDTLCCSSVVVCNSEHKNVAAFDSGNHYWEPHLLQPLGFSLLDAAHWESHLFNPLDHILRCCPFAYFHLGDKKLSPRKVEVFCVLKALVNVWVESLCKTQTSWLVKLVHRISLVTIKTTTIGLHLLRPMHRWKHTPSCLHL